MTNCCDFTVLSCVLLYITTHRCHVPHCSLATCHTVQQSTEPHCTFNNDNGTSNTNGINYAINNSNKILVVVAGVVI